MMLVKRILTGIIILSVLVIVIISSEVPWVLCIVIAAAGMISTFELYRAVGIKDKAVYGVSFVAIAAASFAPVFSSVYAVAIALIAAVFLFVYLMLKVGELSKISTPVAVMIVAIVTVCFKSMTGLRDGAQGFYLLTLAIASPLLTDIGAFIVGKTLGKHPLAPNISPNKTVEGGIGGIVFSTVILSIAAAVCESFGLFSADMVNLVGYLILASVVGQFGDLAFSAVKRISGIKDYGKLLPGHGGFLDRFDSLIFVLPFTYLFNLVIDGLFR